MFELASWKVGGQRSGQQVASWKVLRPSRKCFGRSWSCLGPLGALLVALGNGLGALAVVLEASCALSERSWSS